MRTFTKSFPMAIGLIIAIFFVANNVSQAQLHIRIQASFYSDALDDVKKVDVYLPADYYVDTAQDYATIYYLHGAGGNQGSGTPYANLYYALHMQNTSITSPPAIIVCPDGSAPPYQGSCYLNSSLYGNYEDFIMQDVINFVETNFRASSDKNFRMICGFSMGGIASARFGVGYPEMFRASFPYSGFPAVPDTTLEAWKDLYYAENGNYVPLNNPGNYSQLLLTICGGLSPNMNNPPLYVDFPFDTLGLMVDSVVDRWRQFDASRKVKDLPKEDELAWFLGCGTSDEMMTYPCYLQFMDSLDAYEIGYDSHFFEGGHVYNYETWASGFHWMDSIINHSFLNVGIPYIQKTSGQLALYPNPVSDVLNIEYPQDANGEASICIMDQFGRMVAKIPSNSRQAGISTARWDMANFPAGIYFCRLIAGNKVYTSKFVKK